MELLIPQSNLWGTSMKAALDLGDSFGTRSESGGGDPAITTLPESGPLRPRLDKDVERRETLVDQPNGYKPDGPSLEEVKAYYGGKTKAILRRYGPGPRVHYHTGMVDALEPLDVAPAVLRRRLVVSQERIMDHAARIWNAPSHLSGEVLDVGCGLGGGSIYWAQQFGAQVTAATCVLEHTRLVEYFAAAAGVASRVHPLVCDVLQLEGRDYFDAAVAFDASCHLPRSEWFRQLYALLRPGGRVFISDCFLGRADHAEPFNRYWHAQIGTIAEYVAAAREAGFRLDSIEDLSKRVRHFFSTTLALIEAETREAGTDANELARLAASRQAHTLLRQALGDGGFRYALLSFVKSRSAGR